MERRIGAELHSLSNLIKRHLDMVGHIAQVESVTGMNGWIIGFLSENADRDVYQKDFEKAFSITRSTASKVLIRMEQKGLIERLSVSHDARLKKIVLTQKAWELSDLMKQDLAELERTLTAGFTDEELDRLLVYIGRLKANVAPPRRCTGEQCHPKG